MKGIKQSERVIHVIKLKTVQDDSSSHGQNRAEGSLVAHLSKQSPGRRTRIYSIYRQPVIPAVNVSIFVYANMNEAEHN